MINYDATVYTVNDFREWAIRNELFLVPKYQRRSVWSPKAKSYLMDTIIRGLPIPKIFMRLDIDLTTKRSIREIIDGQQRIRTVLSFLDDGFTIMKSHNKELGGKYFTELPNKIKREILNFKISVDILHAETEKQILDIFSRINTYTVTLNNQEKINSKYFGAFKRTVYSLGFDNKDFFVNNGIITERQVARMAEAELASELTIQIIRGIDDRKKIEEYYRKYDDKFPEESKASKRFDKVIDTISLIFSQNLKDTKFSSKHIFYTLFGVIDTLLINKNIREKDFPRLFNILMEIDNILNKEPADLSQKHFKFYDACTKHVTDYTARKIRHNFIITFIKNRIR